jgi:hypothetical protein
MINPLMELNKKPSGRILRAFYWDKKNPSLHRSSWVLLEKVSVTYRLSLVVKWFRVDIARGTIRWFYDFE